MKLLVGLGNPGERYKNSRHNSGFFILDEIAKEIKSSISERKFNSFYFGNDKFILLKPWSCMNNSGDCVLNFVKFWKIKKENVLIIYDDIYLPIGKFRFRLSGSDGGHNGMKSVINALDTKKIKRLKIGIEYKNDNFSIKEWVLKDFYTSEISIIRENLKRNIKNIIDWLQNNEKEIVQIA